MGELVGMFELHAPTDGEVVPVPFTITSWGDPVKLTLFFRPMGHGEWMHTSLPKLLSKQTEMWLRGVVQLGEAAHDELESRGVTVG